MDEIQDVPQPVQNTPLPNTKLIAGLCLFLLIGGVAFVLGFKKESAIKKETADAQTSTMTDQTSKNSVTNTLVTQKVQPTAPPDNTNTKLTLTVSEPESGAIVHDPTIIVKGHTLPNTETYINDQSFKSDSSGNFSVSVTLDDGENEILIGVIDDMGNNIEKTLTVTYD